MADLIQPHGHAPLPRYVHIKDPLQYTELITRRSVPATIAGIWVTSALISLLPISLNMHAASPEDGGGDGGGEGESEHEESHDES